MERCFFDSKKFVLTTINRRETKLYGNVRTFYINNIKDFYMHKRFDDGNCYFADDCCDKSTFGYHTNSIKN